MIEHCTILLLSIYHNTYISSAIQKLSRVEVSGAVNVVVTCAQLELTARYITSFFLCGAHYRHTSEHTSHVPAMPKNVPPVRLKERSAAAAQPAEKVPLSAAIKYTEESRPTRLDEATEYFSSSFPKAFVAIEGVHSPSGSEGLAKGE